MSNVSPANSNVTNILTSLNNLIASNEDRDSAKHITEVKIREIKPKISDKFSKKFKLIRILP